MWVLPCIVMCIFFSENLFTDNENVMLIGERPSKAEINVEVKMSKHCTTQVIWVGDKLPASYLNKISSYKTVITCEECWGTGTAVTVIF